MRKLQFQDGFKLARIIKKANLKDAMQDKLKVVKESGDVDVEKIGMDITFTLIESAADVEQEVYELLAGVFECDPDQVKTMSFDMLQMHIKEMNQQNNLLDFFKKATNLM